MQIHPTTLYQENPKNAIFTSESVRGEGALLYDKNMNRFCDEFAAQDVVVRYFKQMEKRRHSTMFGKIYAPFPKRPKSIFQISWHIVVRGWL